MSSLEDLICTMAASIYAANKVLYNSGNYRRPIMEDAIKEAMELRMKYFEMEKSGWEPENTK